MSGVRSMPVRPGHLNGAVFDEAQLPLLLQRASDYRRRTGMPLPIPADLAAVLPAELVAECVVVRPDQTRTSAQWQAHQAQAEARRAGLIVLADRRPPRGRAQRRRVLAARNRQGTTTTAQEEQ